MASRLEGATKQFGVPLLVSGQLVDLFTNYTQSQMRMIDNVKIPGTKDEDLPLELFTCDVDITPIQLDPV